MYSVSEARSRHFSLVFNIGSNRLFHVRFGRVSLITWSQHSTVQLFTKLCNCVDFFHLKLHAIDCQRDADCQRDVLFFSPFFLVKRNFLDINHSKNIKFGKNMCIGVIFQKITKNGIFSHFSCIYGSAMTLGGRFFSKKNFSTPIIPVFVFFHLNIRN